MNDKPPEGRAGIKQRQQRQEEWKRVRAEAEATLARTAPPEEIEALKTNDAEFLAAVDKAGQQSWRELCQWFLDHPDKPIPLDVGRAALRWVVTLVPQKRPSGEMVAGLVDLCRARNMSKTDSYRTVAMWLGPMKTSEAVRKDYKRHQSRKR